MGKKILAVLAGYIAMSVFIFVTFLITFLALGVDLVYEPELYDVTLTWITITSILGLSAALLGGLVAVSIAKTSDASKWLAGVVLILGLGLAVPVITSSDEPSKPRTSELGWAEAMQQAKQPIWIALLNPVLGAIGALAAGRMKKFS